MSSETPLLDRIGLALKEAMKARAAARTSALRMIRAAMQNKEIDKRGPLEEVEIVQVLSTLAKQRRESIEQYRSGGREDLARKEEAELQVLMEFLPRQMTDEDLRRLVEETVVQLGAQGSGDLGKVMSAVMPKVKGRADGRRVNDLVREVLSGGGTA